MEDTMKIVFEEMGNKIDVYTYEHRGVARSTSLQCIASQAGNLLDNGQYIELFIFKCSSNHKQRFRAVLYNMFQKKVLFYFITRVIFDYVETYGSIAGFSLDPKEYMSCMNAFQSYWGGNGTYAFSTTEAAEV